MSASAAFLDTESPKSPLFIPGAVAAFGGSTCGRAGEAELAESEVAGEEEEDVAVACEELLGVEAEA